jgi:uncharacterized protein YndB with AHSA1/START domain
MEYERLLEDSIEIDAPVSRVWPLVSDVRRYGEWSPQVTSTRLRNGAEEVALGVQFTNLNRDGDLEWKTTGEIVRFDVEREIAFRVEENWVVWGFSLEPTPHGSRLTQRREAPDGISDLSIELTDGFMGGQDVFTAALCSGMRQTLAGIKAAAEQSG